MKAVILAGGLGTRLSEETREKPKPMVEIGGKPILWHIMKSYYAHGVDDFIICCGYKGYIIKEFFLNYRSHTSDVTIESNGDKVTFHNGRGESWKISLIDTGVDTMTGGRVKRIASLVEGEEAFCLTYGDGLCDVNIRELINFHKGHGKKATVTAVPPPGRFGVLKENNGLVDYFGEKTESSSDLINGGYFVLSPSCLDLIEGDHISWENEPLESLVEQRELVAFKHDGFWQPMDTLREKVKLQELWNSGEAPWRSW